MRGKRNKGFTLIELLVVIIIVGILAAVAVPRYFRNIEKSRKAEAYTILGTLVKAEQRYMLEWGVFTATIGNLDCDNPNSLPNVYFTYTVDAAGMGTAKRNALKKAGTVPNYTITLDQNNNLAEQSW